MQTSDIVLRDLKTIDECRQVVELERQIWGYTEALDIVPVPILLISIKRGGILIGAFAPSGEMVGFVYSLAAMKGGQPTQWSHMLGVVDARRRAGLGRRLKLAQRERAIAMGLDLIEWTFDPLQAANAHLNLASLGAVADEYAPNIYGDSSSPLHRGTPTDRFIVQWWIQAARVEEHLSARAAPRSVPTDAEPANRVEPGDRGLVCRDIDLSVEAPRVLVAIPTGFSEMQAADAGEWRLATREIFTSYFDRGYQAADFFLGTPPRGGSYLLVSR